MNSTSTTNTIKTPNNKKMGIQNVEDCSVLVLSPDEGLKDKVKKEPPVTKASQIYIPSKLTSKSRKREVKTLFLIEGNSFNLKEIATSIDIIGLPSLVEYEPYLECLLLVISRFKIENIALICYNNIEPINAQDIAEKKDIAKPFFDRINHIVNLKADINKQVEGLAYSFYYYELKKCLDKLLLEDEKGVVSELINIGQRKNKYCDKFNITSSIDKLQTHFSIKNALQFFLNYEQIIGDKEFKFNSEIYKYDYEKDKLKVTLPSTLKDYRFIGNNYYRLDNKLNAEGKVEGKVLNLITRPTLSDLFPNQNPKKYLKDHYFSGFTNVPDNFNWKESYGGQYNRYSKPIYTSKKGEVPNVLKMVKHIFGEHEISHNDKTLKGFELGLDYMQLLITKPIQQLPIIVLYSKERETGKSTYPKFLKSILGTNAVKVGNKQFDSEFNEVFSDKLLIWCDETLLDRKSQAEKVKDLSTSNTILVNPKGTGQYEIPFFGKFIFTSNNKRMVHVDEDSVRFWIIEVKKPKNDDPLFDEKLEREIPAFLHFLRHRTLATGRETRMHFHADWLRTDALTETVKVNEPQDVTNIREGIKGLFDLEENGDKILMPLNNIINEFLRPSTNKSWVKEILTDYLKVSKSNDGKTVRSHYYKYDKPERKSIYLKTRSSVEKTNDIEYEEQKVKVNFNGRVYEFLKANFLDD